MAEPEIPEPGPVFRALGTAVRMVSRLGPARARAAGPVVSHETALVVSGVRVEAADVVSVRLVRPGGGRPDGAAPLPAWRPGDHIDLVLPSGRLRQYSLCGDPADRASYRIAVRRIADGDGGSREVHGLGAGDAVRVRGPRAAFPLVRATRYLFLAGGIGITPILPMLRAVAAAGTDWRFVYAGRDDASMPFLAELAELDPSRVLVRPDVTHGGPATGAELLAHHPGPGTTAYLCGPPPMLEAVRAALPATPAVTALHTERFSAPPVLGGRAFTAELARTGERLDVPADRSLLEVLRERRPAVAYSCRQGFCGTCRQRVLVGAVEHRDRALTGPERDAGAMAVCVSRAAGDRLVLDL